MKTIHEKLLKKKYTNKLKFVSPLKNREGYQKWIAEETRLIREFREDLEREARVVEHPKRGRCFDIAWGRGHSAGLPEVAELYFELATLLRE